MIATIGITSTKTRRHFSRRLTTGGGVYKVPGHGPVFGRMENGACIVTVAETGVSTTVIGDGDVCINGHLVATGGKCAVDESGNKIEP